MIMPTWPDGTQKSTHTAFTWQGKPSMFVTDKTSVYAGSGVRQSEVVARNREKGKDIGAVHGLSVKSDELIAKFKRAKILKDNRSSVFNVAIASQVDGDKQAKIKGKL